jgi:hypothetical protein
VIGSGIFEPVAILVFGKTEPESNGISSQYLHPIK